MTVAAGMGTELLQGKMCCTADVACQSLQFVRAWARVAADLLTSSNSVLISCHCDKGIAARDCMADTTEGLGAMYHTPNIAAPIIILSPQEAIVPT